jgi:cytochrome c peroxidase
MTATMRRRAALPLTLAAACALAAAGCRRSAGPPPGALVAPPPWELANPVRPLPVPPPGVQVSWARADVPVTPEKVRLGRWLFFDARLSRDGTISCATCHDPALGYSERKPHSTGIGGAQGTRKAQPILNAAFPVAPAYFWDGRAASLAEQAKGPIANPVEMGNTLDAAAATVRGIAGYRRIFREVYGDDRVDIDRIAEALAAYEATRLSGGSPWDRYNAGDDDALSEDAKQGMEIFFGRGRCNACHVGPNLTDGKFHNVGIGFAAPEDGVSLGFVDQGRYAVTHDPKDIGAFKTPTLRDVARRPPYMHDGSSPDLRDSVLRYFEVEANPWLDPAMREVRIFPFDVRPLVAFLEALDGTGFEDRPPAGFPQ